MSDVVTTGGGAAAVPAGEATVSSTGAASTAASDINPTSTSTTTFGIEDVVRRTFIGDKKGVYSFDYSKKYKFMASCGLERKVLLWDPFTIKIVAALSGHQADVQQVLIAVEQSLLLLLDFLKHIKVWNLKQDHNNLRNIQNINELNTNGSGGIMRSLDAGGGGGGRAKANTPAGSIAAAYRPENRISFMLFDSRRSRLVSCHSKIIIYNARTLTDHAPK
jgi:WD40 repeat protein